MRSFQKLKVLSFSFFVLSFCRVLGWLLGVVLVGLDVGWLNSFQVFEFFCFSFSVFSFFLSYHFLIYSL